MKKEKMCGKWVRKPKGFGLIVFVHGIFSDGDKCWTNKKSKAYWPNKAYWPKMLSEEDGLESLGIYVVTYQSGFFSGSYDLDNIVQYIREIANSSDNDFFKNKLIVFVCHSMGGIVVRKFLINQAEKIQKEKIEIGVFILSSPSLGSVYANLLYPFSLFFKNTQAQYLRSDNENLKKLDDEFMELIKKLNIKGKEIVEDKPIGRVFFMKPIVEYYSGARYFKDDYKLPWSNHSSISKPENKNSEQHRQLCDFINNLYGGPYQIKRAEEIDILWIAEKAKELYGKDCIPYEVKLSWFQKNRNCFWIIKNKFCHNIGSLEVLPLNDNTLNDLVRGKIEEKDIKHEDIYSQEDSIKIKSLYVENLMCIKKGNVPNQLPIGECLGNINKIINDFITDKEKITFYAMPVKEFSTKYGIRLSNSERLLKKCGFSKALNNTKQGYPIYYANVSNVVKNLDRIIGKYQD